VSPSNTDSSSSRGRHGDHSRGRQQRRRISNPFASPARYADPASRKSDDHTRRERPAHSEAKMEALAAASLASDRKQRRYKQATREADATRRERDGKKPFYVTVDREGVPYGAGRPAWMNEINKLSIGLDPSCTHIRKQTYEDVIIFKERLSQCFEYSGELNEEYLRGLMGRAVGRRRGELIKMIKRGETQPKHIDSEVWARLVNYESSEQWREKSEQGKHANASRKTINRTGNRGVNGVRESLREVLGRSPDPDEVYAEAHRPKGCSGAKTKKKTVTPMWEDIVGIDLSEGDERDPSMDKSSSPHCDGDGPERISPTTSTPQVVI
jgi:hypothetical protein